MSPQDLQEKPKSKPVDKQEHFLPLKGFEEANKESIPLNRLDIIKKAAPRVRDTFMQTGKPRTVRQFLCSTSPYPTVYGFHTLYKGPAPYLHFNNRATLVQFEVDGKLRNLLFNPFFPSLSEQAPFYQSLKTKIPAFLPESLLVHRGENIIDQLAQAGLKPEDIDYISYDHLHVQDMRPLMGTKTADGKIIHKPLFPNAHFIFPESEWTATVNIHPVVGDWYVHGGLDQVNTDKLLLYKGDILLGPGVAIIASPGHTPGNHSLYLNTDQGTITISENGVGPDGYNPQNSSINDIRNEAIRRGWEVVMNANTLDQIFDQYNSMVKEKMLSGPSPKNGDFCNHHSSSEFTRWFTSSSLGLKPSHEHGVIVHGPDVLTARN